MKFCFYIPVCQLGDPFLFRNVSRPHQAWIPEPMSSKMALLTSYKTCKAQKSQKNMYNEWACIKERLYHPPMFKKWKMNKKERNWLYLIRIWMDWSALLYWAIYMASASTWNHSHNQLMRNKKQQIYACNALTISMMSSLMQLHGNTGFHFSWAIQSIQNMCASYGHIWFRSK